MATTAVEKAPNEIVPVSVDFSTSLDSGDTLIPANVSVVITNLLTDADTTATIKVASSESYASSGACSIKVQGGAAGDGYEVLFRTGLTTQNKKYEAAVNLVITSLVTVNNLLCDLDEVKRRLEIDVSDTSDDLLLFDLMTAASDYIRNRCRRDFTFQKYTEKLRPDCDADISRLKVRHYPLLAVDSITLREVRWDGAHVDTALETTKWSFNSDGYIWLLSADCFYRFPNENIVAYRAGYIRPPADIREAAKSMTIWFYRLVTREGLSSERIGDYAYSRRSLTDFPTNMRYELPDEYVEGIVKRYARYDLDVED